MTKLRYISGLIMVALSFNLLGQHNDFSGFILSDKESVEYAYLLNHRTNIAVETAKGGSFHLKAIPGDTIRFSCLGYRDTSFTVDASWSEKKPFVLNVHKESYSLDEVQVVWFYSYAAFKQAFLNLKIDEKTLPRKFDVKIDYMDIAVNQRLSKGGQSFGLTFGASRPYFTKEQLKEKEIRNYDNRWGRYNHLTSHENLAAFTGLKGTTLDSFVIYLRTHFKISPDLKDYDIMLSVQSAFESFLAMKEITADTAHIK